MAAPEDRTVIIRDCPDDNAGRIHAIVSEAMEELGFRAHGRVLLKPNVVTANRVYIRGSHTDLTVVGVVIDTIRSHGPGPITIGESSGYGIPPRLFLREAGYFRLGREKGVRVIDFNEEPARRVCLERGQWHKSIRLARAIEEAETKIWLPKLKYHITCTVTNALKLNIGILTHRERLLYHDDRLDEKIVDLLEPGWPDLVVTDAIDIGHGFESTPRTFRLGAILISRDPLAIDAVACRILNYRPAECRHLLLASERGYGSIDEGSYQVTGDVSIEELASRTKHIVSEFQDIQKVDTPLRFYTGTDGERGRVCHGGCLTALKGCLGTIDMRRPGSLKRARPGHIVTGIYTGDVGAPGEDVLLLGDCTRVVGTITARRIRRVGGCPMGAKDLFITLPLTFGLPSPIFDLRDGALYIRFLVLGLARRLFTRIRSLFRFSSPRLR